MELLQTIKRDPRKKRIIVGILILLIATVAIVAFTFANKSDNGAKTEPPDNDTNSLSVFKTADDEESSKSSSNSLDTVEPIDLSGINGLEYVSKGDGTCYIDGIGSCKDTELKIPAYSPYGDIVIKINDGAFENCTELLSITIPSTVKTVGTGAFRGCSSLVAINVDTENSVYCSVGGVLLSKDKTVLVCMPMNRPGSSYLLSTDTKAVAAYAFEGVINLKSILYQGSIADFQKIDFLMGNDILDTIQITCNYVSAK
ncbi:MAG: leucine-rich repeat protein [Clostridia bacterium]|nr:leucine-rich repeat protein [Clostridia bacterium]